MKIKIVQYFIGNNEKYLELAHEVEILNRKYAEIHEYDYDFDYLDSSVVEDCFGKCTPKEMAAYKLQYILDKLGQKDCDYLVFMEADVVVSKPTIKIENLIDEKHQFFISRNNDVPFQIKHINNILHELQRILSIKNRIYTEYWTDILKIENKNNLYDSLSTLSSYCFFHNEGFYIIKNVKEMEALFIDAVQFVYFLEDIIYDSSVVLEGRALCMTLLKEKYNSLFTFLPAYIQGAEKGAYQTKYNSETTFLLHEYGTATTLQQKINEVKNLHNNKWWMQVLK